nr:uncharacterized protein LOC123755879 [Procambarus clarkii]
MAVVNCYLVVVIIAFCGLSLPLPSDDQQEPVSNSQATLDIPTNHEKIIHSLDMDLLKPRLESSSYGSTKFESIIFNIFNALNSIFHFIVMVVDKDSASEMDMVDESWSEWIINILQFLPLKLMKKIYGQDLETVLQDIRYFTWKIFIGNVFNYFQVTPKDNSTYNFLIKGETFQQTSTGVTFDPIGQFLLMIKHIIKDAKSSASIVDWLEKVLEHLYSYSFFNEQMLPSKENYNVWMDAMGIVNIPGMFTVSIYDPVKFILNALIFIGANSLFLTAYVPGFPTFEEFLLYGFNPPPDYDADYGGGPDYADEQSSGDGTDEGLNSADGQDLGENNDQDLVNDGDQGLDQLNDSGIGQVNEDDTGQLNDDGGIGQLNDQGFSQFNSQGVGQFNIQDLDQGANQGFLQGVDQVTGETQIRRHNDRPHYVYFSHERYGTGWNSGSNTWPPIRSNGNSNSYDQR